MSITERCEEDKARLMQEEYYDATAADYDRMHLMDAEHEFAIAWLTGLLDYYQINSILDVGAGTGRLLSRLKEHERFSNIKIMGVEPVAALREKAYQKGIREDELIAGDGTSLEFENGSWDLVCEFGVLHHIAKPAKAVQEMLRVSRKAVFISDSNIYAAGGMLERAAKQTLRAAGLWKLSQRIKTRGKMYKISEGDGLWYPYSVYDNYKQISDICPHVHVMNTSEKGVNPYRRCCHVALFACKDKIDLRSQASFNPA